MIPLVAKDLKYTDKKIIEQYACSNSFFKYEEAELFEKIGEKPYSLEVNFYFKCEILHFIDDKIRIRFYNNDITGIFNNT